MSEAAFYFENGNFDTVIEGIVDLPEPLRPMSFCRDEGVPKPKNLVSDAPRFRAFLKQGASGMFLHAERAIFSFFPSEPDGFCLYVPDIAPQYASMLMHKLGGLDATFAYACETDERRHRNCLVKKAAYGTDEAWVGRSLARQVPGVYWLTVISESLAKRHDVPLEEVKQVALATDELASGIWLLKFFDSSSEWRVHAPRLDKLCEETHGIFSISSARLSFEKAKTFLEAAEILHTWR